MKFNRKKDTLTAAFGLTEQRTDELYDKLTKLTDKDTWSSFEVLKKGLGPLSKKAEIAYVAYIIGLSVARGEMRQEAILAAAKIVL